MALQGSGSISFSQITNEFGTPPGRNLGAYRVNQNVGTLGNRPLDDGIPQSGAIRFGDFYNKRLNIVVDLFNIPQDTFRRDARNRYNNNGVVVIGGFRSKPSSSSGTKVFININRRIGSAKGNRNNVALRTGLWDSNTDLRLVVGPSGSLMGAGGNGGAGSTGNGGSGTTGTSALGIQYPTRISNQGGFIFGARGGGGGGGGGQAKRCSRNQRGCKGASFISITGGGGAGGRGFPAGNGGSPNGGSGTVDSNGSPGPGSSVSGTSAGFNGFSGAGGIIEQSGGNGNVGSGGPGGTRGYAIIVGPGGSVISYSGNDTTPPGNIVSGSVL
jgi:hypothetical protein